MNPNDDSVTAAVIDDRHRVHNLIFQAIVPLLAALIGAAFQAQFQNQWAPWVRWMTGAALVVIVLYSTASSIRAIVSRIRRRLREQSIDRAVRGDVLAVASTITETTNSNFALSAGNVAQSLAEPSIGDIQLANAYGAHLSSLESMALSIKTDVSNGIIRETECLRRLIHLHRAYVQLCFSMVSAAQKNKGSGWDRSWDAIRERANATSARLSELAQRVQIARKEVASPVYFQNVPRT